MELNSSYSAPLKMQPLAQRYVAMHSSLEISLPFTGSYNQSAMNAFVLLVLSTIAISTSCFAEHIYYVTPSLDKACPSTASSETCQTLGHYVNRSGHYFQSDTTFYFLNGTHWLNVEEVVTIMGIERVRMIGDSQLVQSSQSFISLEPSAVISCNSSAGGFAFGIVKSLLIANLSFMHCGADVSKVADQFLYVPQGTDLHNITITLGFFLVEDLDLSGVLVQNNTGYGLATLNLLGNSSITESAFIFNKGTTFHPGGNTLIIFMFSEQECSQFPVVNLTIKASKFMYGSTQKFASLPPLPPGLRLFFSEKTGAHLEEHYVCSTPSNFFCPKQIYFFSITMLEDLEVLFTTYCR